MATFKSVFLDDYVSRAKLLGWCPTCGHIWDTLPNSFSQFSLKGGKPDQELRILWNFHLGDLITSAAKRCQFCSFIAIRFFDGGSGAATFHGPTHTHLRNAATTCCAECPSDKKNDALLKHLADLINKCDATDDDWFVMHIMPKHTKGRPFPDFNKIRIELVESTMEKKLLEKVLGCRRHINLEIFATKGSNGSKYITTPPINLTRDDPSTFELVRIWVEECHHEKGLDLFCDGINKHDGCADYKVPQLPTRVIEIIDDKSLRLHVSKDSASYTTLSYCWGGPQTFATTTDTLAERCKGFLISHLPQTLQEAITVTRELGLKYIWIDSLCIIQDSADDKYRELGVMPEIYKNAYVTITAAIAESCGRGFLKIEGECESHPGTGLLKDLFKMPCRFQDSQGMIYMHEETFYSSSNEHASCRAWTLQEHLLSPRIISYGTRLMWYCRTTKHCHGGTEDWSFDELGNRLSHFYPYKSRTAVDLGDPPLDLFNLRSLYSKWYDIIAEYSRRNLTFHHDKLPAIAGLAEEFHKLTGDTYLGGLWKKNLYFELMWSTHPEIKTIRPTAWRAPSWSWASVDNAIYFDKVSEDSTQLGQIIDSQITPRSRSVPFGEVTSGVLRINAYMIHADRNLVREMMHDGADVPRPHESEGDIDIKKRYFNSWAWKENKDSKPFEMATYSGRCIDDVMEEFLKWTEESQWQPPDDIWCLVLFSRDWYWNKRQKVKELDTICYSGLVLTPVENGRFERIGSFHNEKRRWLGGGSRRTITIV